MSRGKIRWKEQWESFARFLETKKRGKLFEESYHHVCNKVSGLYKNEARSIWNNLQIINPKSLVEVGRNLGGSLWLFACACPQLERILSIDIEEFELTDSLFREWFDHHNIQHEIIVADSTTWQAKGMWDFVFIDGGHTGEIVKADIEVWKDCTRYIGFHDYADKGNSNKHKRVFHDVVEEISIASEKYGWTAFLGRGRSEIVFRTPNVKT